MSINRTRWLDKLRPAGASSGGWTEGPMAPVETTELLTRRHNHSNSNCVSLCAWVKRVFSVSRIKLVIFAQGSCSLRPTTRFARVILELGPHTLLQTTRFVRVILEQGAMSSSQNDPICACHPCASHISVSLKKTDYPSQIGEQFW